MSFGAARRNVSLGMQLGGMIDQLHGISSVHLRMQDAMQAGAARCNTGCMGDGCQAGDRMIARKGPVQTKRCMP